VCWAVEREPISLLRAENSDKAILCNDSGSSPAAMALPPLEDAWDGQSERLILHNRLVRSKCNNRCLLEGQDQTELRGASLA
jgi:hypothetical protein